MRTRGYFNHIFSISTLLTGVVMLLLLTSGAAHADLFSKDAPFGIPKREFLPVEEAFIPNVENVNDRQINITFDVQEGYYLYKDKFKFSVDEGNATQISLVELPKGKEKDDPLFGLTEVYSQDISIPITLTHESKVPSSLNLTVAYQGCAEDGICYPPQTVSLPINFGSETDQSSSNASTTTKLNSTDLDSPNTTSTPLPALSQTDSIAAGLASRPVISLLLFFGFGLALSLTPCVFPMIPILSGILIGQGQLLSARKSFFISVAYVLGMAITYAIVGIIAGLFGKNLQAAFQAPWVLMLFSGIFVALAFSMFGFYNIQLPSSWQSRLNNLSNSREGGTFSGAALMGIFSAIIVGPCVAPPLAGALIYIGQSGNAGLGGLALFSMGLGMGVPLLLLGASAGKLLPRAGVWMETVKHIFGVLMLGVAIWLLERIIPAPLTLALWGILLIGSAVYMGALDTLNEISTGWQRLWKAVGISMLLYGGLLIVGSASGADDVFKPLKNITANHRTTAGLDELHFTALKGTTGLERALADAQAQNKPLMLDFYADWCIECKRMEKTTFTDDQVLAALGNTLVYQADVTANDAADQALLNSLGLFGPPAILFYAPNGEEKRAFRITGYAAADAFAQHVIKANSL